MIVAYSSGPSSRDAVTWMRTPRPGSPRWKNWSPTIAPITDRPAEVRRPTKIEGSAAGICSLRSRVSRPAPWSSKSSRCARSTDCRPKRVLDTMGNSAIMTVTITREREA